MKALEAKEWDDAKKQFSQVVSRFPSSPLVNDAKKRLLAASDGKLTAYLETVDGELDMKNRDSFTTVSGKLNAMIAGCKRCKSARVAAKKLKAIQGTMKSWPVQVDNIATLKVKYADLRGKSLMLAGLHSVKAATYYNCGFKSQGRWRSFKIMDDDIDSLYGYCRRGNKACEELLKNAISTGNIVANLVLKYPRSNRVCQEGQIEMLSWVRWTGISWE